MAQGPPALDSGVALTFDDVLLVPAASEVLPGQADVSTQLTRDHPPQYPGHLLRHGHRDGGAASPSPWRRRAASASSTATLRPRSRRARSRQVKKYESGIVLNPVTIHPAATLARRCKLMAEHSISGVPVVEDAENG